jgi:hypothetical protein
MPDINIIRAFLQHASSEGSRSTVLKPIGGMIAICIPATLTSAYLHLDVWVTYMFAIFCVLLIILYLFSYLYCLFSDRDALRSETYKIKKMAIEKGFIGDNLMGIFPMDEDIQGQLIGSAKAQASEVDK